MKKLLILSASLLLIMACKNTAPAVEEEKKEAEIETVAPDDIAPESITPTTVDPNADTVVSQKISVNYMHGMKDFGDAYQVLRAWIENDELWMTVNYGGGCTDHEFQMRFNNAYKETAESDLSEIHLTLFHNANGDACRSIQRQVLRFNLKDIQNRGSKGLKISLFGWDEPIIYTYGE